MAVSNLPTNGEATNHSQIHMVGSSTEVSNMADNSNTEGSHSMVDSSMEVRSHRTAIHMDSPSPVNGDSNRINGTRTTSIGLSSQSGEPSSSASTADKPSTNTTNSSLVAHRRSN